MNTKHYTPEEFITVATLEDGIYWLEADGHGHIVTVPEGADWRRYGLRGALSGSITVEGGGDGDAIRYGDNGHAIREGDGDGDAIRHGGGYYGSAIRYGGGSGDAIRGGNGDGDAIRDGSGRGDAIRRGDGNGDAVRDGNGDGSGGEANT